MIFEIFLPQSTISNAIIIIRGVSVFLGHVKFNLINDEAVTFYSAVLSVSYFAPKMRLPLGLGPQTSFTDNLRGNRQSQQRQNSPHPRPGCLARSGISSYRNKTRNPPKLFNPSQNLL